MGVFSAVDAWLDRLSGGQIRRAQSGERECMQCRALGTLVFGAAAAHSGVEAIRARPRSGNRVFFTSVGCCFLFVAVWRAITPTVPHNFGHEDDETPAAIGAPAFAPFGGATLGSSVPLAGVRLGSPAATEGVDREAAKQ
eukprot:CAMPEP_0177213232 /NCGR_PEP_ID=MMETSP0367-20130122/33053_1 /TAXON_ID=447022 ORGANISM="Scrippsiella hangoei-like, Strain SHHI-4" /NCGR_SAMPLE_ID=MMETSP0367 /ASSEMBLY_ACC=CAM_ASM_000362 /LENGTH=139 /DNA_ID=CAMNT_0018662545 /DNA_START=37 /DNA_END=456 /DNA_ORIENTATION=+